ncbi:hypothetical protein B0H11DRAFT_330939 [Mycena galericulata]|nr:hypothetical protein B0H11DRAFT_330939 [Mycena galericulata]
MRSRSSSLWCLLCSRCSFRRVLCTLMTQCCPHPPSALSLSFSFAERSHPFFPRPPPLSPAPPPVPHSIPSLPSVLCTVYHTLPTSRSIPPTSPSHPSVPSPRSAPPPPSLSLCVIHSPFPSSMFFCSDIPSYSSFHTSPFASSLPPSPTPSLRSGPLTAHPSSLHSTYMNPGPLPLPLHPTPSLTPYSSCRPFSLAPAPAPHSSFTPLLFPRPHPPCLLILESLAIPRALPSRRLRPHLPPSVSPTNTPPTRNFIFAPPLQALLQRAPLDAQRAPAPRRRGLLYLVRGREP